MTELGAFLLPVVPLLALLACLLLGRYPGCEAIVRLAERISPCACAAAAAGPRRVPARPASYAPGGGLLLALSLSGRAPPA